MPASSISDFARVGSTSEVASRCGLILALYSRPHSAECAVSEHRAVIAALASGDVGIWHETFRVRAGEYEALYGNMPVFGLAAAARHLPTARKANTAAARIGASTTDEPAVETY